MKFFQSNWVLLLVYTTISFMNACIPALANAQQIEPTPVQKRLADLEASVGGRIGVSAINTANNMHIQYRADERFPFCSTSKVIAVSDILKQSMTDDHLLQQKIMFKYEDVDSSGYAPITKNHVMDGMTISELCDAAIIYSDNAAMNLLIKKLGGLDAVTAFANSIGDNAFRLDRFEPGLNTAIPDDLRDTTTPSSMERSLHKLALGDVLGAPQREQLQTWLQSNTTGNARIRAGLDKDWVVGDKTGTGDYGTTNDIGIIWPPNCSPIVVVIYFTQNKKEAAPRNDVIESITRIIIDGFSSTGQCIKEKS